VTSLAFIEACSTVETEVEISGRCLCWVAFIDKARLLDDEEEILRPHRLDSLIGFDNAALAVAVKGLRAELTRTDDLSNLYIESWAIQALVHLHRSFDDFQHQSRGRLTKNEISKVVDFMEANIAENITLECIATLVGLSPRHFRRLFRASVGVGPLSHRSSRESCS
jgi:Bacterial regulatory helix-turn-helix proteins, AraC family